MTPRSPQMLVRLLRSRPVVEFDDLRTALGAPSDATVFRYLKQIPYRSSYNQNGRYYALHDPDRYDRLGLFSVGDAYFSVDGTARATVIRLVNESEAGRAQRELEDLLHIRVQPFLLEAIRQGAIERERFGRLYLYFHREPEIGKEQRRRRQESLQVEEDRESVDPELIIRVLLVLLRHPGSTPGQIAHRLVGRAPPITRPQVDVVFTRYGLGEKGGPSIY